MKKKLTLNIVILFFCSANLWAHALNLDFEVKHPFVIIEAGFSKNNMVANANVEVLSPETEEVFQKGRTDSYGRFIFMPDMHGLWKVKVDDNMGHRREGQLEISTSFFEDNYKKEDSHADGCAEEPEKKEKHRCSHKHTHDHAHLSSAEIPLVYKIIFGLAIIFGITGLAFGLKSGKK